MQLEELKQILKEKPRKAEIQQAIELESKTRFFTDPAIDIDNAGEYSYKFTSKVQDRLNNEDSFNNFKNNLSFPLKINEFLESVYSKLSNIWQGQNPYYDYSFTKDDLTDYHEYITLDFFKTKAWNEFKTHHNSIILTDLPEDQQTEKPEPFNSFIRINSVVDIVSNDNCIKHVVFVLDNTKGKEKLAVIDNEVYQIFDYKDEQLGSELLSSIHGLDRCPCVWLSQIDFNSKSNIIKANPISKSLGKVEDLQIIYTLKNILSPYAFYQFIVKYKNQSSCDYDNGEIYCVDGYLKYKGTEQSVYKDARTNTLEKCPQCNKTPGVGDIIAKPIPMSSDEPDLKNVIEFVAPDTKIMEYGDKYISILEGDLFDNIVGTDENLNPNENHNETAYKYNTEGQQDVIFRWKSMFENVISQTHDNILELRYGEIYESNSINLGTDFILADIHSLYTEKEKLKELGLDTVFDFNKTIINAKYQNNPEKKRRALVIDAFKPFDESIDKVELSYKDGLINQKDYIKQKYLSEFINYFENEKISITQFEKDLTIGKIKEVLDKEFEIWYQNKIVKNEKRNDQMPNI
jgi:hypothetical protein